MKKKYHKSIPKKQNKQGQVLTKRPFHWQSYILDNRWIFLIMAFTFLVFANALKNQFLNWDDNEYIFENPYIRDFSINGVITLFSVFVSSHYHPLTLLSYTIDFKLWGLNPMGFVLGNIVLHIFNVFIVYHIFNKISKHKQIALITALLFAIHPMRVESVVWMSARKDELYSFFYLLAIYQYIVYLGKSLNVKFLLYVFGFYILSLFSKGTAVSLPLVLLLIDYFYKRRDYQRIIIEKLPFIALSIVFGLIAIIAQSETSPNSHPFKHHFFLVTYAITFYIVKFFAPLYQSALFEFPQKTNDLLPTMYYFSALIIPIGIFCVYYFKSFRKELLFAMMFFGITIGLFFIKFPIGPFYLAERYTYIPYLGFAYLIGVLYMRYRKTYNLQDNFYNPFFIFLIIITVVFSIKSFNQTKKWENNLSLWEDVVAKFPDSPIALVLYGNAKEEAHSIDEALNAYNKAIELNPTIFNAFISRGNIFFNMSEYEKAIKDYNTAISLNPTLAKTYNNRGSAKAILGDLNSAIEDFSLAIKLDKNYYQAYLHRSQAYMAIGNDVSAQADKDMADKLMTVNIP